MKRSRFSEEQIIAVLKEQEAGISTAEVGRRHGISSATFCKWKSKFGGLKVSDARRLRTLEQENSRLNKLLADAMLDNVVLKDLVSKMVTPGAKREAVAHAREQRGLSERRACGLVGVSRRVIRYEATRPDNEALRQRLRELAAERRRFGYRRLGYLLAREGMRPNHKKLLRIYREEGLHVRTASWRASTAVCATNASMRPCSPRWPMRGTCWPPDGTTTIPSPRRQDQGCSTPILVD